MKSGKNLGTFLLLVMSMFSLCWSRPVTHNSSIEPSNCTEWKIQELILINTKHDASKLTVNQTVRIACKLAAIREVMNATQSDETKVLYQKLTQYTNGLCMKIKTDEIDSCSNDESLLHYCGRLGLDNPALFSTYTFGEVNEWTGGNDTSNELNKYGCNEIVTGLVGNMSKS